jgi:hypothetical protein
MRAGEPTRARAERFPNQGYSLAEERAEQQPAARTRQPPINDPRSAEEPCRDLRGGGGEDMS